MPHEVAPPRVPPTSAPALPVRVVAHLDLDCYYAQVEMLRTGARRTAPFVLVQWGRLIAVNYPARAFGIKRFATLADAQALCPHVQHAWVPTWRVGDPQWRYYGSVNKDEHKVCLEPYREASKSIMGVLRCPGVPGVAFERGGIDEAFLDVTGAAQRLAGCEVDGSESDSGAAADNSGAPDTRQRRRRSLLTLATRGATGDELLRAAARMARRRWLHPPPPSASRVSIVAPSVVGEIAARKAERRRRCSRPNDGAASADADGTGVKMEPVAAPPRAPCLDGVGIVISSSLVSRSDSAVAANAALDAGGSSDNGDEDAMPSFDTFAIADRPALLAATEGHETVPWDGDDAAISPEVRAAFAAGALLVAELRAALRAAHGYDCSAGVASNKLLAKLISATHKPNRQTVLWPGPTAASYIVDVPVERLRGFGGKLGRQISEWFAAPALPAGPSRERSSLRRGGATDDGDDDEDGGDSDGDTDDWRPTQTTGQSRAADRGATQRHGGGIRATPAPAIPGATVEPAASSEAPEPAPLQCGQLWAYPLAAFAALFPGDAALHREVWERVRGVSNAVVETARVLSKSQTAMKVWSPGTREAGLIQKWCDVLTAEVATRTAVFAAETAQRPRTLSVKLGSRGLEGSGDVASHQCPIPTWPLPSAAMTSVVLRVAMAAINANHSVKINSLLVGTANWQPEEHFAADGTYQPPNRKRSRGPVAAAAIGADGPRQRSLMDFMKKRPTAAEGVDVDAMARPPQRTASGGSAHAAVSGPRVTHEDCDDADSDGESTDAIVSSDSDSDDGSVGDVTGPIGKAHSDGGGIRARGLHAPRVTAFTQAPAPAPAAKTLTPAGGTVPGAKAKPPLSPAAAWFMQKMKPGASVVRPARANPEIGARDDPVVID